LPLLAQGLKARIAAWHAAEARTDEATAVYRQTVLRAFGDVGDAVPSAFQHHHEGHPLLQRQLAQPVTLVRGAAPDRSAEHGHVLGSGQRGPAVDTPGAGHEGIARYGRFLGRPHELADLRERTGIEEPGHPFAGVQTATVPLTGQTALAPHGLGLDFPPLDLVENGDVASRGKRFDLLGEVLADPGQLREVFAGRGHRGDGARQLSDDPGSVPISADPKGIGAFELEEICELVETLCNIGIQDRHDQLWQCYARLAASAKSGFLRIDPDQLQFLWAR